MAIVKKIKLQIISSEELRDLENKVVKMEGLATRADKANIKIRNIRAKRAVGKAPIQTQTEDRGGIFSTQPSIGDESDISKKLPGTLPLKSKDTTSQQPVNFLTEWQKLKQEQLEQKYQINAMQKVVGLMPAIAKGMSTPVAMEASLLGLGTRLPVIGFAFGGSLSFAEYIYSLVVSEYGPGGTRDRRKLVTDATLSYLGTEDDTLIFSGQQLFLGDPTTHKGVLHTSSNTQNLQDGLRRFNLRTNGFWH